MPPIQLSNAQLNSLPAFLLKLNPANSSALESASQFAVEGAMVYQRYQCSACHQVNGAGARVGPSLNGLASRRDRVWVVEHFANPQKVSPGTVMPVYRFGAKDLESVTSYLIALPNPG